MKRYSANLMKSTLIIISGLPSTGKSTIAEALGKKLKFPVFSVGPIESAIIQADITKNFATGLAAYLVAKNLATEQLKLGLSVIIDAVSPVQEARDMWLKISNKYHAQLKIIECILDPKIHRARIEQRVRNLPGFPEVTWSDVEKQRKEFLPWEESRLVLDMSQNLEENITRIFNYLN